MLDTFRGVGGGVVESHTAGEERLTGLETPKVIGSGSRPEIDDHHQRGRRRATAPRQGCTDCEAP